MNEVGSIDNPLTVSDGYVRKICSSEGKMTLIITDTNPETSEETIVDSISLDISGFVYPDKAHSMSWQFENLKTKKINYLKLTLSTSGPFLTEFWKKKLNPLLVNIIAAKSIPQKSEEVYSPIYCVCKFNDDSEFKTIELR